MVILSFHLFVKFIRYVKIRQFFNFTIIQHCLKTIVLFTKLSLLSNYFMYFPFEIN